MKKPVENGIHSSIKNLEKKKDIKSKISSDPFTVIKYKEYFKSFIEFKKCNSNNTTYLKDMYLHSRDKYQKFVANINSEIGLRFEGNKNYSNLSLNTFKNDYLINTINISNELKNNTLRSIPFGKKELSLIKKLEGEKMKLTPIPFKKEAVINNREERKKIQEIKRSAVFMRKVEYTHLINNIKSKHKEPNYVEDKIYILKGAVLIIEDWWKKIKSKRKLMEEKKRLAQIINYNNNNKMALKKKSKGSEESNKILHNNSTTINSKALDSYNNSESSQIFNNPDLLSKKINENEIYKKRIISDKMRKNNSTENNSTKKNSNIKPHNKSKNKNNSIIYNNNIQKIRMGMKTNSSEKIKEKNFKNLNKNNNTKEQNLFQNSMKLRQNYVKKKINNTKINSNLKDKYATENNFDIKDENNLNISLNSKQTIKTKQNSLKKDNKRKEKELLIKTNYFMNKKFPKLNREKIDISAISDNQKENNSEIINLKKNYNTNINSENQLSINKDHDKNKNIENKKNASKKIGSNKNDNNVQINIKKVSINLFDDKSNDNENDFSSIRNKEKLSFENNDKKEDFSNKLNEKHINQEHKINQKDNDLNKSTKANETDNSKNYKIQYQKINVNYLNNKNDDENKMKEKNQNKYNIVKSQEVSFAKNKSFKGKQLNNLSISSVNEITFLKNKPRKFQKIEKGGFEIVSTNNNNILNKSDGFKLEKKFFSLKNDNSNIKKNNKKLSQENFNIEIKKINNENEDSEIIPIEPDNQNNLISGEKHRQKEIKNEDLILSNNYSFKKEKSLKNFNKKENENIVDFKNDNSKDKFPNHKIRINFPKTDQNNLLENNNKYLHKNEKGENGQNKLIEINNFKTDKLIIYINNTTTGNNKNLNPENNNNHNRTLRDVPNHIKEMYKLYRSKSVKEIKLRKYKNFEFLRTLHNKFDYE